MEALLAELENGAGAIAFGSGLAAEHALLQALLKPGDRVVIPPDVYGGTFRLLHQVFEPRGYEVVTADFATPEALRNAIGPRGTLIWMESPTNPRLLIYDIQAIAAIAHECGALLVVDNTFATPVLQQPFALGADLVVHSVTKYLAGHSDVIQGAVIARDTRLLEPVRFVQNACGAVPSPFDCWLTLRGVKTLELRVRRHVENATAIAEAAQRHPAVQRVYYPGLSSHPGHEVARRQMSGFGGMLSLELRGDATALQRFVSGRRYFALGESLGGTSALICHPATMTHASIPAAARAELGLSDQLVRLSPGVEDPQDLVEDILAGLDELAASAKPGLSAFERETIAAVG